MFSSREGCEKAPTTFTAVSFSVNSQREIKGEEATIWTAISAFLIWTNFSMFSFSFTFSKMIPRHIFVSSAVLKVMMFSLPPIASH